MGKSKNEVIQHLIEEYEKWDNLEQENVNKGIGMRGSNASLSGFSFDDLFNEIAWRLYVGLK